jgi:hypothetical protein
MKIAAKIAIVDQFLTNDAFFKENHWIFGNFIK